MPSAACAAASPRSCAGGQRPLYRARPDRRGPHVDQGHVRSLHRDADDGPVDAALGELLERPARPPAASGSGSRSAARRARALSRTGRGRSRRPRSRGFLTARGRPASRRAPVLPRAGRRRDRSARASRRSCRSAGPAGRRSGSPHGPAAAARWPAGPDRAMSSWLVRAPTAMWPSSVADVAQLAEPADVDQGVGHGQAELHERHQRVAAGQELRVLAGPRRPARGPRPPTRPAGR